ncbi:hypothetical protein Hlac_3376 (plasmid) [Halorubrum lacusprofundi ATCC 49239]|uniref:Uncharacterized protein n=1 Tax=Halorubrum lacusprofundi (strain ATCC 49239 / DSM 5036 / JCM 8891 / ACAM 34) TaxID=416348 RepID=B9LWQ2_HALLT|nr:hypothetical protein Hlac_3376 [Halorubrum lacusprofundi ATCC 49239]
MITQSAQPPLPFLTAGEGPPETARLASVTRRSVSPWIVRCQRCPDGEQFLSERPARRWAETHARHTRHAVRIEAPTGTDDVVSGENDQSHS